MNIINVVGTYEIFSTKTTHYIFMKFCFKGQLFNISVEKNI